MIINLNNNLKRAAWAPADPSLAPARRQKTTR